MRGSLKYALYIFIGLIFYFGLMKLLGLHQVAELRIFNFIFVAIGVYTCIKNNMSLGNTSYLQNLILGFITAAIAIILFTFSVLIYLHFIDPDFVNELMGNRTWYTGPNPSYVALAIFSEGIASSFIISFASMQYLKKNSLD